MRMGGIVNEKNTGTICDDIYDFIILEVTFKSFMNKGVFKWEKPDDGKYWYGEDIVYEFKVMPNKHVTGISFTGPGAPDKLRVNQWNKVKAVYSPSTKEWTVYLNGKYYDTYTVGSEGKYRFAFNTPVGISDTLYMDNIRVYQAPAGIENFEEATIELPETYELTEHKKVADIKKELGMTREKYVAVY